MSSSNHNEYFRSWMDRNHQDPSTGLLTEEFVQGLQQFMSFASNQQITMETGKMYCPCPVCKNRRFGTVSGVWKHLYSRGFMAGYKIWYSHGETDLMVNFGSTSEENNLRGVGEQQGGLDEHIGTVQMVEDRFRTEEPNFEAQKFYDMLDAAKNPLYDGCREGEVQDPVAREMLATLTRLKEGKEAQLQQSQLGGNDGSTASNVLSREEINQMVLEVFLVYFFNK